MTQDKKVYTPEISLVYSYGLGDSHPFSEESLVMEAPTGFEPVYELLQSPA